jgi:hypothetical protein
LGYEVSLTEWSSIRYRDADHEFEIGYVSSAGPEWAINAGYPEVPSSDDLPRAVAADRITGALRSCDCWINWIGDPSRFKPGRLGNEVPPGVEPEEGDDGLVDHLLPYLTDATGSYRADKRTLHGLSRRLRRLSPHHRAGFAASCAEALFPVLARSVDTETSAMVRGKLNQVWDATADNSSAEAVFATLEPIIEADWPGCENQATDSANAVATTAYAARATTAASVDWAVWCYRLLANSSVFADADLRERGLDARPDTHTQWGCSSQAEALARFAISWCTDVWPDWNLLRSVSAALGRSFAEAWPGDEAAVRPPLEGSGAWAASAI